MKIFMRTVLVVEYDDLTRLAITYMLDALNYLAVAVSTPLEANDALESIRFDVMLYSLNKLNFNGVTVVAEAKKRQPGLTVIILSAWPIDEPLKSMSERQVLKPFSLLEIREVIEERSKA